MQTPDLFDEQRQPAEYHYHAALAAARAMREGTRAGRAGRQLKVRTCRELCDHLRRMLRAPELPQDWKD